jgi:hypothetical protein
VAGLFVWCGDQGHEPAGPRVEHIATSKSLRFAPERNSLKMRDMANAENPRPPFPPFAAEASKSRFRWPLAGRRDDQPSLSELGL